MAIRTLWLKTHLWVGLAIALPLIVVSLTGAVLVFEDALDRALHPNLSYVTPGGPTLPLQDLLTRVRAAYPDARLGAMSFPESPDESLQVLASTRQQGGMFIAVNQYTGQVLGHRTAAEREVGLARRMHVLHTRLFAGQVGEWIVGTITFFTLLMAITGLVLWWPRRIVGVKTGASWRRVNFDLHNVFGLYASASFLFIALTGMMISFEAWTDPWMMRLNATPLPEMAKESAVVPGATPMSVDALARAAQEALPGAFLRNISIPNGGKGVVTAGLKYPEDRTPGGRSRVALDQYSGTPLTVLNTRTAPLGTKIVNLKRAAHTGDIFGATTRALYFITCLLLAGQIVTGFLIWWKRPANVDAKVRAAAATKSAA